MWNRQTTHQDWSWKKENLIKVGKIDSGFGVDITLKKFHTVDLVSKAKQLLIAMVSKLIEKSPLGSNFLLSLSVLHPQFLRSSPGSTVLDRWKIVLTYTLNLNILSTKCCDDHHKKTSQDLTEN